MKFNAKQILSVFLTMSLLWVFVGCAVICAENEDCIGNIDVSSESSANFDETSHEDFCPIKTSIKTTAPERIVLKFDSSAVSVKGFTNFSPTAVLSFSHEYPQKFYCPPKIISHEKRLFILRI